MFLGYGVFLSVFCFSLQMRVSMMLDKDYLDRDPFDCNITWFFGHLNKR